ncbi:hypothetical protein NP493_226g08040 [Ridgeia piscesae]|uniref:Uncharacterized protein n=1 Tax=Ridgeia piscesae TaxID=27915 RepID=A0AAD9P064_RIDPI|nr:hypothetical protein NP493_226g08040 [Ridgeia piscesae]
MPFPEDDGISVGPGTKTGVGLRRHTRTRMPPPYGDCADYTAQDNLHLNAYVSDVPTVQYSTRACMKTCFQRHLMEKCGCYSTQFPVGRNSTAYAGINVYALRPCEDDTQEGIAGKVYLFVFHAQLCSFSSLTVR